MSLYQTLSQLRIKYAKMLKPGLAAIMDAHMEHLRASGAMDQILTRGSAAPSFSLRNSQGESFRLHELLQRGPVVLSFYRGSWCPYCVEEIKHLNEHADEIAKLGATLVVISPQAASHSAKQTQELGLRMPVLVDENNQAGKAFGLVYSFPEDLKDLYLNVFKNDLPKHNGTEAWELPIPARIVIGQGGVIVDVKADPDYRFRPEAMDTIQVLEGLAKKIAS